MRINYSRCWEDPATLAQALAVTRDDDVVSIASGGDNALALLLGRPRSLTAVDVNPAQLHLLELKMRAIEALDHGDLACFLGARPCRERTEIYDCIKASLGAEARRWWDGRRDLVSRGVLHCGRFERFLGLFRRVLLPLAHSRKEVEELLACPDLDSQRRFFHDRWDNRRWRWLFRLFFSRPLLGGLGRAPSSFRQVDGMRVADELLRRTARGLTRVPVGDNFFLELILAGEERRLAGVPPYLAPENLPLLREQTGKVRLVHAGIREHLEGSPPGSHSKFNFSDVFEYMPDGEFSAAMRAVVRTARDGARLAYWSVFVPRPLPPGVPGLVPLREEAERLRLTDRAFFYGDFHLARVAAPAPLPGRTS